MVTSAELSIFLGSSFSALDLLLGEVLGSALATKALVGVLAMIFFYNREFFFPFYYSLLDSSPLALRSFIFSAVDPDGSCSEPLDLWPAGTDVKTPD